MDLSIVFAQLSNIQEAIVELKNKQAQAEVPQIAPAVDKEKIAIRSNSISANVTRKEHEHFDELVTKYAAKFKRRINANRLSRTIVRHFVNNWDTMPMAEEWKTEDELREYRFRHKRPYRKK